MMQNAEMRRIARDRMTATEMSVLLLLCACADDQGYAVGTLDDIVEELGYARNGVARALVSLVDAGRLEKVKRGVYRIPARVATPAAVHAR